MMIPGLDYHILPEQAQVWEVTFRGQKFRVMVSRPHCRDEWRTVIQWPAIDGVKFIGTGLSPDEAIERAFEAALTVEADTAAHPHHSSIGARRA